MKVTQLEVTKGTTRNGNNINYRLVMDTSDLDAKEVAGARIGAEQMIDAWLSEFASDKPESKPIGLGAPVRVPALQPASMPTDIAEIDALPWLAKNKEKPQQGTWGWILSDPEKHTAENAAVVRKLLAALKAYPNGVTLGQYDFRLNGDKDQFIHRVPHKEEGAK